MVFHKCQLVIQKCRELIRLLSPSYPLRHDLPGFTAREVVTRPEAFTVRPFIVKAGFSGYSRHAEGKRP
jgi:hypothetical protein